jgi:hypothetical protein
VKQREDQKGLLLSFEAEGLPLLDALENSVKKGEWKTRDGKKANSRNFMCFNGNQESPVIIKAKKNLIDGMIKKSPELGRIFTTGTTQRVIGATRVFKITIPPRKLTPQSIHRDTPEDISQQHLPSTALTTILLAQDTTKAMGATQVWPGSINQSIDRKHPMREHQHAPCVFLEGKRGDVYVFDVLLHHRGGQNLTNDPRTVFSFMIGEVDEKFDPLAEDK